MNALLLTALLLGGADSLTPMKVHGLTIKAPMWNATDTQEGRIWDSPGSEAKMELSVYAVDPKRPAQQCLDQLMEKLHENMGKEGWDTLLIGAQPAVRKVTTDYVGEENAEKTEANKISTVTYVGCNGASKWVLTMSSNASKSARFGVLLKAIVTSIAYGK